MVQNVIVIVALVLIIGLAGFYVYKAKKSGKKCIGCTHNGSCDGNCGSCDKNK